MSNVLVICSTVNPSADNSAQRTCSECGADVWIAPSSQAMEAEGNTLVCICMGCFAAKKQKITQDNPELRRPFLAPGALQEVSERLPPEKAARLSLLLEELGIQERMP